MLPIGIISAVVINQQIYSTHAMGYKRESIMRLLEECKSEPDLDNKIQMLYALNSMLPKSQRLKIPSLITNDYVYQAVYRIEEMLLIV